MGGGASTSSISASKDDTATAAVLTVPTQKMSSSSSIDLHHHVQYGTEASVADLLNPHLHGMAPPGDVKRRDINGLTPLHKAAIHANDANILCVLLEYGADRMAKDGRGDHPIDKAREYKKADNIAILLNYHPNMKNISEVSMKQDERMNVVRIERDIYAKWEADRVEREKRAKEEADRIEKERGERAKEERRMEKERARRALLEGQDT